MTIDLDGTELALLGACLKDRIDRLDDSLSSAAELAWLSGAYVSPEEETIILVRSAYQRMADKIGGALMRSDERMGILS